jgi:hypothetical protein
MKKPRSDSKLKSLPVERQEQIIAWANTPKSEECVGGLAFALEQLKSDGLTVSMSTLADFVSWWRLQQRFSRAASRAEEIAEMLRQQSPDMSPEKVRSVAQSVFTLEAVDAGDAETYVNLEHLQLKRESAETKARLEQEKLVISRQRLVLSKAWSQLQRIREQGLTDANKDGVQALLAEFEALGVK